MQPSENILETALGWMRAGREIAFATVINTHGSSPRPVGSQLLIDEDGNFEGSVSGGCIEGSVVAAGMEAIALGKPRRIFFDAAGDREWEVGLACGGEVEIFVEPLAAHRKLLADLAAFHDARQPACLVTDLASGEKNMVKAGAKMRIQPLVVQEAVRQAFETGSSSLCTLNDKSIFIHVFFPDPELVVIGAVHIAQPLALMAQSAGYGVTIIDPREAFATLERFPDVRLIHEWPDNTPALQSLHLHCALVALSHEPKLDDPALLIALRSSAFYVGALGSRKTHAQRIERLIEAGLKKKEIDRLHAPVGLDIGARNAPEIAIAIMAEITQCRHC